MHPENINIQKEEIKYAEEILLPEDCTFDEKRTEFIKDFHTLELHAVPGSGKTTALMAKLLILEKYLPFENGSGILVISHTNRAVEEIKNEIGKYCPKLFSYPNFVGTIQKFVNNFLTKPKYNNEYKNKPKCINSEEYVKKFVNRLPNNLLYGLKQKFKSNYKSFLVDILLDTQTNKLKRGVFSDIDDFPYNHSNPSPTYKELRQIKKNLINEGVLSYKDAYYLAFNHLKNFSHLKQILQQRFVYTFVDEMQDMDRFQIELLNDIFLEDSKSVPVYQMIGDTNQSIYSGSSFTEDILWKKNPNIKTSKFKGSYRLSVKNSNVIQNFSLDSKDIDSWNNKSNIPPHLVVFDEDSIPKVKDKFIELINQFNLEKYDSSYPYYAIGWTHERGEGRLGIKDYFSDYNKNDRNSQSYTNMITYLSELSVGGKSVKTSRDNILQSLVRILNKENIKIDEQNRFTKNRLLNFLEHNFTKEYDDLRKKILNWSKELKRGEVKEVHELIQKYIQNSFFECFENLNYNSLNSGTQNFIESADKEEIEENKEDSQIYKKDSIELKIDSVHAVKGMTHSATLYLETFYQSKYESERLKPQFCGKEFSDNRVYHKQSAKIAYVGMSRPKHLLCFAIHKDRFDPDFDNDYWKVIDISN
ncbi:MAG: UvrD-helicase domain-containing protein [Candidatus Magasanikbacteria bacterium]